MVLCFAGFQLDRPRAELRGPGGEALKLRPKTLCLLILFATNPGRVLSKRELMDAVWPNVHVGDDSLFQCIREIRTALGDERRQLVRLVSGHGYVFEAEVSVQAASSDTPVPSPVPPFSVTDAPGEPDTPGKPDVTIEPTRLSRLSGLRRPAAMIAALSVVVGLAVATAIQRAPIFEERGPPTIAVMPIKAAGGEAAAMAANVTVRLADGLAKIENIRVVALQSALPAAGTPQADFVLSGELQQGEGTWDAQVRMTRTADREVVWTAPATITVGDAELSLQQSRLAASIGHPLAVRISTLLDAAAKPTESGRGASPGSANVVIEQATASILRTTRDRFATAQTMLEKALAGDPENVDLAVSLAALQLRGIQMVWYSPADSAAAETRARAILERALQVKPSSIPVLEAYCRFLNATNEFVESLVACARTLNFDPWNGLALYHIGLAQLQLGRFEDALATFKQADRFDTPQVSRWTWLLGAGMTYLFMGRSEEALPWLLRSIAITPASGRPYMLLAAAYQQLGRPDDAKAAMDKALALRPGSNTSNVKLPPKNASAAFLAAGASLERVFVAAGLPER
ncbi:lysine decarboxylase transcriptional regulator, CadC [Nitrobacter hamburgensis X14]|uniref:Lysine decarboxylase transcriptional regulator, CadC n=1 Tax=Nitrobacter hamburgensis (strain DSM 10229 / NCIMB 13809 / X14) TaxID=323097 RepID=Q1QIX2_NITHX|nr:winged helix-turn-helix domain-containing protein [Nitrobacter hamburgensis]ABE63825.1 lysine decarboxylase transcriptional regulator, CadC [Nitrobacter hamburgensis X14]